MRRPPRVVQGFTALSTTLAGVGWSNGSEEINRSRELGLLKRFQSGRVLCKTIRRGGRERPRANPGGPTPHAEMQADVEYFSLWFTSCGTDSGVGARVLADVVQVHLARVRAAVARTAAHQARGGLLELYAKYFPLWALGIYRRSHA